MTDRTSIYIGQALRRLLDDRPEDKGLRGAAKAAKSQQFSRDVTQAVRTSSKLRVLPTYRPGGGGGLPCS